MNIWKGIVKTKSPIKFAKLIQEQGQQLIFTYEDHCAVFRDLEKYQIKGQVDTSAMGFVVTCVSFENKGIYMVVDEIEKTELYKITFIEEELKISKIVSHGVRSKCINAFTFQGFLITVHADLDNEYEKKSVIQLHRVDRTVENIDNRIVPDFFSSINSTQDKIMLVSKSNKIYPLQVKTEGKIRKKHELKRLRPMNAPEAGSILLSFDDTILFSTISGSLLFLDQSFKLVLQKQLEEFWSEDEGENMYYKGKVFDAVRTIHGLILVSSETHLYGVDKMIQGGIILYKDGNFHYKVSEIAFSQILVSSSDDIFLIEKNGRSIIKLNPLTFFN
jgi:hypothetical protein